LNNPLPSPLNNDADTDPVMFTSAFINKDEPDGVIVDVCIIDAENGAPFTTLTELGDV
jgi:hypothetical protein